MLNIFLSFVKTIKSEGLNTSIFFCKSKGNEKGREDDKSQTSSSSRWQKRLVVAALQFLNQTTYKLTLAERTSQWILTGESIATSFMGHTFYL